MKKFILLSAIMIGAISANATIWRVNNTTGVDADFTNLQTAVTSAVAGDTIHLEPSATGYGNVTVTKKITIIGNGYFQDGSTYLNTYNTGLKADTNNSSINSIIFQGGGEYSMVTGCYINNVYIHTSNITVKRNYVYSAIYLSNYTNNVYGNVDSIDIRQNVISQYGIYQYQFSATASNFTISDISIQNNILYYTYNSYGINLAAGMEGFIQNNVFAGGFASTGINVYNFQINNNILVTGTFTPNNNVYFNNIGTGTQFGTANNNQSNVSTAAMFTSYVSPFSEEDFEINPTGPAAGTGFNGVDVGIYGGPDPYRKSGIPPVPSIYQLSAPATTTSTTLPVTISTRSND